jgi:hypothetical protein
MHTFVNSEQWWRPALGALVLCAVAQIGTTACQHQPSAAPVQAGSPASASVAGAKQAHSTVDETQPALAYCVPRVPNLDHIAFTLDYDGTDGSHEPRFSEPAAAVASASTNDDAQPAEPIHFSRSAHAICQSNGRPLGRRYQLRVPAGADPRRLDEYVRLAARRGYDQPIFKLNKALVAAQIIHTEYTYSPTAGAGILRSRQTLTAITN